MGKNKFYGGKVKKFLMKKLRKISEIVDIFCG